MSLAAAAHQAWGANIFTIVSDIIPKRAVSSVVGLGGMSGSIASTLFPLFVGVLLNHYKVAGNIGAGYNILFIICGSAYMLAWIIIQNDPMQLVKLLGSTNGWVRDKAQQKLVDGKFTHAIPELQKVIKETNKPYGKYMLYEPWKVCGLLKQKMLSHF